MGRNVLVGICGGIAAYKVCEILSSLAKEGYSIRAIATDSACRFITPLTIATLCRHAAYTDNDFWQPRHDRPLHIALGEWADALLVAPLTANTLAKLAWGIADNLLTNTILASRCPVAIAPAANVDMWQQPVVQRNFQQLLLDSRYHAIGPEAGVLACDTVGVGRMAEPQEILCYVKSLLRSRGQRDWQGKRVLVSTGGTREYLDPVRFLGNPATGKMGVAIARAAAHRGADVILVCGAVASELLPALPNVEIVAAPIAEQMHAVSISRFASADVTFMAAAVADVRPAERSPHKLPKRSLPRSLPLVPVTDIIAELADRKQSHQRVIGFAAQTGDPIPPAIEKLQRKGLDAIVANPIDREGAGFASDTNQATWIDAWGNQVEIPRRNKLEMAHDLLDLAAAISPHENV